MTCATTIGILPLSCLAESFGSGVIEQQRKGCNAAVECTSWKFVQNAAGLSVGARRLRLRLSLPGAAVSCICTAWRLQRCVQLAVAATADASNPSEATISLQLLHTTRFSSLGKRPS